MRFWVLLLACVATRAALVPRLSFEELIDQSDIVAAGHIQRSWVAWDAHHKYLWTHYELGVTSLHKGAAGRLVEFAEPGGTSEGIAMQIAGSVVYVPGENVFVFLQRMPNGYLRTTGWAQGKYSLGAGQPTAAELGARVAARMARAK